VNNTSSPRLQVGGIDQIQSDSQRTRVRVARLGLRRRVHTQACRNSGARVAVNTHSLRDTDAAATFGRARTPGRYAPGGEKQQSPQTGRKADVPHTKLLQTATSEYRMDFECVEEMRELAARL